MGRKARIGITRDFFDQAGKSISPGPGPNFLDEMLNVEWQVFPEYTPEVNPEHTRDFDIVITAAPKWTKRTLAGNTQLLSLHRNGVGYDMVDVRACTNAGVALFITPAAVRRPVAVGIITFILALSTKLMVKDKITREGLWADRSKYHGIGLTGKTLGSIGVGNIGHEMFALAKPFDMKHIAHDLYVKPDAVADVGVKLVDMDTVLAESDFLNISCPLNEETRHLVGEKELRKMKKSAFLINAARGPIIDEAALVKALKEGWIQGAGIDVFEHEPTPAENALLKLDNVILAPHAIAWTDEFFITCWHEMSKQISQLIRGEKPQTLVNPEVWNKPEFQSKLKEFQESLK